MNDFGFLAIVPALIAIGLALKTKNIFIALFSSIVSGAIIVGGFNPVNGFLILIKDYIFVNMAEPGNAQTLFMMSIISGFVALLTASGASLAFSDEIIHKLTSRSKGETSIWLSGLAVWFTDTGNSIIIGPIWDSTVEKLRISREKFAYILDMTAICDCALIPIVGWGVYTMGLIDTQLTALNITNTTSWDIFLHAVPYNFYAILGLSMAGFLAYTQFDFGPMLKAQNRAALTGQTIRVGGTPMRRTSGLVIDCDKPRHISTMIVPVSVLFIVIFSALFLNGFPFQRVEGTIIRASIAFGFISATVVLILLCVVQEIMTFQRCIDTFISGIANASYMCVILVLAWALGGLSETMGTAEFIIGITKEFLSPGLLPGIIFLIGAIISFSTGTSWGTMAILMPVALPMAVELGVPLPVLVAAVLSGGLFGDSTSPVSDTTILASTGAGGDHVDFFNAMMPYSITVGVVSFIMFILAGMHTSPYLLPSAISVLIVIVFAFHKRSVRKNGKVW